MFKSILIANRGEIACRIARTCRRMGINTIAVFSDADRDAQHAALADQAYFLGASEAAESYLNQDKILNIALAHGAQAIHPGFGFLAENPDFARKVVQADMVFIGPHADTISRMGSKSAAKNAMKKAGIAVIPGYQGTDQSTTGLRQAANKLGYPLMIKASAGGGGKGMRVVAKKSDFSQALTSARRESQSFFDDDQVILEKLIQQPRHVEVQIFGDSHGKVVHLWERDCSVQRRYQKIIEESPCTSLNRSTRKAITAAAVKAGKAAKYLGAGTVEFIVDADNKFYFMEMNTRIQVEHPVTEMVTGLDLVEWQLRVAAGEPLPLSQAEISHNGHALECRICAEDPGQNFLPSSGKIAHFSTPKLQSDIRLDSGFCAGDSISPFYDSMLAKLIVHASDREAARSKMLLALSEMRITGLRTNLAFLESILASKLFCDNVFMTTSIDDDLDQFLSPAAPPPWPVVAAAACTEFLRQESLSPETNSPWQRLDGWAIAGMGKRYARLHLDEQTLEVIASGYAGEYQLLHEGSWHKAALKETNQGYWHLQLADERHQIMVDNFPAETLIGFDEQRWRFQHAQQNHGKGELEVAEGPLRSPLPGKILEIRVKAGDQLQKGQDILLMEAMKMEISLTATHACVVRNTLVAAGDFVEAEKTLVEFEGVNP